MRDCWPERAAAQGNAVGGQLGEAEVIQSDVPVGQVRFIAAVGEVDGDERAAAQRLEVVRGHADERQSRQRSRIDVDFARPPARPGRRARTFGLYRRAGHDLTAGWIVICSQHVVCVAHIESARHRGIPCTEPSRQRPCAVVGHGFLHGRLRHLVATTAAASRDQQPDSQEHHTRSQTVQRHAATDFHFPAPCLSWIRPPGIRYLGAVDGQYCPAECSIACSLSLAPESAAVGRLGSGFRRRSAVRCSPGGPRATDLRDVPSSRQERRLARQGPPGLRHPRSSTVRAA